MSTHNVWFCREIRKIFTWYPSNLNFCPDLPTWIALSMVLTVHHVYSTVALYCVGKQWRLSITTSAKKDIKMYIFLQYLPRRQVMTFLSYRKKISDDKSIMRKCTFWHASPTKTQISLRICAVWSVFIGRMEKLCIIGYPKCVQWRFWSVWTNVQPDGWHVRRYVFLTLWIILYQGMAGCSGSLLCPYTI